MNNENQNYHRCWINVLMPSLCCEILLSRVISMFENVWCGLSNSQRRHEWLIAHYCANEEKDFEDRLYFHQANRIPPIRQQRCPTKFVNHHAFFTCSIFLQVFHFEFRFDFGSETCLDRRVCFKWQNALLSCCCTIVFNFDQTLCSYLC